MNTALTHSLTPDNCSDLPPLPKRILSRDQTMIETDHSIWQLSNPSKPGIHRNINWGQLDDKNIRQPLSRRARHLLKLYLADRLSKREALTVRDNYNSFLSFMRWLPIHVSNFPTLSDPEAFNWSDITEGLARAFLEWNMKHRARKGIDFTCLRAFYAWGIARGYPDFQQSTLHLLQSIKAPNNAKGHNVRFRHPTKGPFSPDELFSIRSALQGKKGTEQDRAIVMLHLELGLNSLAIIRITNADFKCYETKDLTVYQINQGFSQRLGRTHLDCKSQVW